MKKVPVLNSFPQAQVRIQRTSLCSPLTSGFAEHCCIVSFTAGIKTLQPTARKWGREVDYHAQNNAVLYFCFRNAIEEQSQAAGKHSLHSY